MCNILTALIHKYSVHLAFAVPSWLLFTFIFPLLGSSGNVLDSRGLICVQSRWTTSARLFAGQHTVKCSVHAGLSLSSLSTSGCPPTFGSIKGSSTWCPWVRHGSCPLALWNMRQPRLYALYVFNLKQSTAGSKEINALHRLWKCALFMSALPC